MGRPARAAVTVDLSPEAAERLWTDVRRWPSFVEGFKHAPVLPPEWPEPGAKLVWESLPGGRGRVTERVTERLPGRRLVSRIYEQRMHGEQTVTFTPVEGRTLVEVELHYELSEGGPIAFIAGAFFVRRAIRDSLRRTLGRYAVEAAEDASFGRSAESG